MRRSVLFVVSLVLAVSLAGADWALAQQPKRGGVIRIAEREAPGLDPHLSISFLTHSYVSLSYSHARSLPQRARAEEPDRFLDPARPGREVDGLEGRQGLHVQSSQGRALPQQAAGQRPRGLGRRRQVLARAIHGEVELRDRFEPVQAIDVVDRYTVRITLKEPYAPFLNHLANPTFCAILPREAEDKFKDFNHPDAVIGTGPFVLKSYEKGVARRLRAQPDVTT